MNARFAAFLSLFTSLGTLLCCALPALFVALGLGAVVAGAVTAVPALVWLSERKGWVFGGAALMLVLAGVAQWHARNLPCPVEPEKAAACTSARRWSLRVYLASVLIYLVGAGVAFVPGLLGE